jgi:hypothetical protein
VEMRWEVGLSSPDLRVQEPVSSCVFDPVQGVTNCNSGSLYFSGCTSPGCTSVTGVQESPNAQSFSNKALYSGEQAKVGSRISSSLILFYPPTYLPTPV